MPCFSPVRRFAQTTLFPIATVASLGLSMGGCTQNSEKSEASTLIRLVTELRMADNARKRAPLDRLQAMSCSAPSICETRDACVRAFKHHVRGVELGAQLRSGLGSDAAAPPQDPEALLLEMNVEVEEGRKLMPDCEQRVASLRSRHRL